ncbi:MAG TPA: PfkB family carbohydrate kinase [Kiritimatiellia bacterium]|nr:PfkB family carbohydrate kinase [Kiritimatiellia bacterium]
MSNRKIVELKELAGIIAKAKARGRKAVHCHGVFDILHIGHVRHFRQAREAGDILVVTVTPDRFVNKGPGRPVFGEDLRMEMVASVDVVDYVAKNHWPTAVDTIKLLKPSFYVKGDEYKDASKDVSGGISVEEAAVRSVGGEIVFTNDIVFSSSNLINKHMSLLPKEVTEYLSSFGRRHPTSEILGYLKKAEKLKVLVIGEAIIDEYEYCEAIGKSSKEPTLAVRSLSAKKFAGGILAVANHVASVCDKVGCLAMVGDRGTQDAFIDEKLNPKVKRHFFRRKDSPTIVKKRLIEHYFFTKMLEVYSINDAQLDPVENKRLCALIRKVAPQYDLVIAVDFGHSMMTPEAIATLAQHAKFMAVNAQANAGNMGYNVISKYPRADYITLAEKEMRLEARDHRGDLRPMIKSVSRRMKCGRVAVTCGRNGSLVYDRKKGYSVIPALAGVVVDRVGAGDAFLSISALCAAQGAPMELVGFVGNVVGAWAVSTVCNEKAVDRIALYKQIETLLK